MTTIYLRVGHAGPRLRNRPLSTSLVACLFSLALTAVARGQADSNSVDFARDVYPLLRRSCFECHGDEKQEGGLRLDRRDDVLESGVTEGPLADNELLRRVSLPKGDDEVMPAVGDPLTAREVSTLRRWLEQGGQWPDNFEEPKHWSYIPPTRPALPEVSQPDWPSTAIDYFVLRRLDAEGLKPAPVASPEKRIRRLYLDLIGLPPTPAEVAAFAQDPSANRYEAIVDQLLARPQFGERWARHWLDLARYADSHGFQRDNFRDIWAYRDWVIRALNDDMPYDQFTIEQVAGDLLPNATESQRIATGFHRCTPTNVEAGSLPEETRIEQVIDRVNTTGAVWLGSTLECCQCHDHKYDPFTSKDYYRLLAFFNSTEREADRANPKTPSSIKFQGPSMPISNPQRDAQRSELEQELASIQQQLKQRRVELEEQLADWVAAQSERLAEAPQDHTLEVVDFQSQGTSDTHEVLESGAILLRGDSPPDVDTYVVRLRGDIHDIRAIKLDVLRHESLPGMGPGRGDPKARNFVLNRFQLHVVRGEERSPVEIESAQASFSQAKWDVNGTLKTENRTGWAISPQFDRPHWATFLLKQPLTLSPEDQLVVTLDQQWGRARTIGCFRLSGVTGNVMAESLPSDLLAILKKEPSSWNAAQRKKLVDFRAKDDEAATKLAKVAEQLQRQIDKLAPDTTLVMVELETPRPSAMFQRGDYRNPGEPVQAGTPEILHDMPAGPPNRLTLARWLVSRDNPLTARVAVNRWWAEFFGAGLVTTPEDFGIKGDLPSHPDLLDWLAVELMENGWSTKHVLKTIVMSSTYQQSSAVSADLRARDDRNRLLARGARLRMDAERIRDNALAISGLLDLKQFGPPIRPYQPDGIWSKVGGTAYKYEVSPGSEQHRRGIYVVIKRGSPYPSFVNFDATARLACTVQRSRTNTPLQALTLLNDKVYVEAARAFAERIRREKSAGELDDQLTYAFQACTARRPTPTELTVLRDLFEDQLAAAEETRVAETAAEPAAATSDEPSLSAEEEAWYSVATVLLNLHETITKD